MITSTVYAENMEDPVAYCEEEGNNKFYYVCVNLNGDIYNPHNNSYITESIRLSRIRNLTPFKYRRISPNGFRQYSRFIMEKDKRLLNMIQREVK